MKTLIVLLSLSLAACAVVFPPRHVALTPAQLRGTCAIYAYQVSAGKLPMDSVHARARRGGYIVDSVSGGLRCSQLRTY